MSKLIILQTVAPDYRKKIFSFIKSELNNDFLLFCGDNYFENSVKTDYSLDFINKIKNHYFFSRKILFQTGMWSYVLKKNIMIIEMNPRIISNWLILILRKSFRRKTVLWGHAWPRNGQKSKTDIVRNWMREMASILIVYTMTQAKELSKKMPKKLVLAAPNSLFYSNEMKASRDANIVKNIIYVGRLHKSKKPLLLTKAFFKILDKLPKNVNLIIVGDGPEKNEIELFVNNNHLYDRVILKGHVSDYEVIKQLYHGSLVSVSPGYVGLSITQSFSFGVPMLISKKENHSPELEAAVESENSIFFETDNIEDLANKLLLFFRNKKYWINKRKEICSLCKGNYSIEIMARTFINIYKRK